MIQFSTLTHDFVRFLVEEEVSGLSGLCPFPQQRVTIITNPRAVCDPWHLAKRPLWILCIYRTYFFLRERMSRVFFCITILSSKKRTIQHPRPKANHQQSINSRPKRLLPIQQFLAFPLFENILK